MNSSGVADPNAPAVAIPFERQLLPSFAVYVQPDSQPGAPSADAAAAAALSPSSAAPQLRPREISISHWAGPGQPGFIAAGPVGSVTLQSRPSLSLKQAQAQAQAQMLSQMQGELAYRPAMPTGAGAGGFAIDGSTVAVPGVGCEHVDGPSGPLGAAVAAATAGNRPPMPPGSGAAAAAAQGAMQAPPGYRVANGSKSASRPGSRSASRNTSHDSQDLARHGVPALLHPMPEGAELGSAVQQQASGVRVSGGPGPYPLSQGHVQGTFHARSSSRESQGSMQGGNQPAVGMYMSGMGAQPVLQPPAIAEENAVLRNKVEALERQLAALLHAQQGGAAPGRALSAHSIGTSTVALPPHLSLPGPASMQPSAQVHLQAHTAAMAMSPSLSTAASSPTPTQHVQQQHADMYGGMQPSMGQLPHAHMQGGSSPQSANGGFHVGPPNDMGASPQGMLLNLPNAAMLQATRGNVSWSQSNTTGSPRVGSPAPLSQPRHASMASASSGGMPPRNAWATRPGSAHGRVLAGYPSQQQGAILLPTLDASMVRPETPPHAIHAAFSSGGAPIGTPESAVRVSSAFAAPYTSGSASSVTGGRHRRSTSVDVSSMMASRAGIGPAKEYLAAQQVRVAPLTD